jgi:hypothetical protein
MPGKVAAFLRRTSWNFPDTPRSTVASPYAGPRLYPAGQRRAPAVHRQLLARLRNNRTRYLVTAYVRRVSVDFAHRSPPAPPDRRVLVDVGTTSASSKPRPALAPTRACQHSTMCHPHALKGLPCEDRVAVSAAPVSRGNGVTGGTAPSKPVDLGRTASDTTSTSGKGLRVE